MSGIFGRIDLSGQSIERSEFRDAFAAIAHYGRDGAAELIGDTYAFGIQRLNLSDQHPGHLDPIDTDRIAIVSDAIVNNRRDLADMLGFPAADISPVPDNIFFQRAYEKWGMECPAHILGDYAFSIYDKPSRRLILARDHIGARPLYWARRGNTVLFSTDIRAILACKSFEWPINEKTVARYIMGPPRPLKATFFKHIHVVPPGSYIVIDPEGVSQTQWWDLQRVPELHYRNTAEYVDHFRALMAKIGADHTATQGNIGAHISGGIDSCSVAAFGANALKARGRNLTAAYSWAPAVSDDYPFLSKRDERHNILRIGQDFDIPIRFGKATGESQKGYLELELELNGIADLSDEIPVLEQADADDLRVMLSGWGGDEAYSAHGMGYLAYALKRLQFREVSKVVKYYTAARRFRPRKIARALMQWGVTPMLPDPIYLRFAPFVNLFKGGAFPSAHILDLKPDLAPYNGEDVRLISDPRQYLITLFQMEHLNMRMETWAAWSSRFGFQYRYPLLDRRLIEFVIGMPRHVLFADGSNRYLARMAAKDILPENLTKHDQANEALRDDNHLECWQLLRDDYEAGAFSGSSRWLDMDRLRHTIAHVPETLDQDALSDLAKLLAAVRIWHMENRVLNAG